MESHGCLVNNSSLLAAITILFDLNSTLLDPFDKTADASVVILCANVHNTGLAKHFNASDLQDI